MRVGVIGASGFTGGELLRLLLSHPRVEVTVATSREYADEYVFRVHPNLRGVTELKFSPLDLDRVAKECDVVFLATPHGVSVKYVPPLLEVGMRIVDLSADFRLKDLKQYKAWYGWEHPRPDLLKEAVYGLPELHRGEIKQARLVACPGCTATASILALAPLVRDGLVDLDHLVVDVKMGSSGAGSELTLSSHHSIRAGVIRPYAPAGHRHCAEIEQELGRIAGREIKVAMSAHAVDIVRGILSTGHAFLARHASQGELWKAYRSMYSGEPFVRIVKDKKGLYRLPDPKVVIGTNFCDVGFELDERVGRVVALAAIDNLVKGAAGQAVQCFNIMMGYDEREGLGFFGAHPL
ncbi:MAG: N-acetyl-gamma-glutamyl-phosphate reductase [Candidatus Nezhaarchaeota archaeon]|nr:N-acetyl-gamma-glutamyl-phosphate reductase [Candidatus Nezhaarchaeota archaeon]